MWFYVIGYGYGLRECYDSKIILEKWGIILWNEI